jgi:hypothetical protein
MIPNNIVRIMAGPLKHPHKLPLVLQSALANVKLLHPCFQHLQFDDAGIEAFLETYFPHYRQTYHSFRYPIQRYDFFRYLVIYQLGGFYLDLDIFLARDLTPLLTSRCVFTFEDLAEARYFVDCFDMDWQLANYAFGAEPGHPFLAAVIENCLRAKEDPAWVLPMLKGVPSWHQKEFYILNSTGPGLVSRTFAENPHLATAIDVLFPADVCDRETWHHFGSYGVHLSSGTWRKSTPSFVRRLTRVWDSWKLRRVLREARARGPKRRIDETLSSGPAGHDTGRL